MYLSPVSGFLLFTSIFCSVVKGISNPCRPNPCQNGGTCISVSVDFTCNCSPGYYGEYCHSDTLVTTAESSPPPSSTEGVAATSTDIVSSTSSSPVAMSVTYHQLVSSQSSTYVIVPATNNQNTSSPSSISAAVFSNTVTSQLKGPSSSNFFDEAKNVAIVSSLSGMSTAILSSAAYCYFSKRKSKNSIHEEHLTQNSENS